LRWLGPLNAPVVGRRSSWVNAEQSQLFLEAAYFALSASPGNKGEKPHPVTAGAGVAGDPFVGLFWVAVEKRIAERSPYLRDVSTEMDYFFKKSGALRLCLVKLPTQAGDLFVSVCVVHLVVPLRSVRRRSFDVVDHDDSDRRLG
jgi:hypothetical protein